MLTRLRRRLSRRGAELTPLELHWQLNHRVEHLYQLHQELRQHIGDEMAEAAAGYVTDFGRRVEALEASLRTLIDGAVERAFLHANAATEAAASAAVARSFEHTNAAVAAAHDTGLATAREHAESAVAAGVATAVGTAREHAEATAAASEEAARQAARLHAEALSENLRAELLEELARVRRAIDLARRTADAPAPTTTTAARRRSAKVPAGPAQPEIDPAFYVALEDRFRGPQDVIAAQQRRYLDHVRDVVDAEHPLLDLGCGRGEWLRVLQEAGIEAAGVDSNPVAVAECREAGLKVEEGDLVTALAAAADGSLGAVTLLQVVEHLPFGLLLHVFRECARVLRPGGLLIAETPNALNLQVAATTFWLDPTHQRPLHPELLRLIATESGFARSTSLYMNRLGAEPDLDGVAEPAAGILARLVETLDGPGDLVFLAWTPG